MKVVIGSDHAGYEMKELVKEHLVSKNVEVLDVGANGLESVDYPVFGQTVGEKVIKDKYVKDATWESTISHEIGHYISFYTLLKQNKLENIFLENDLNKSTINIVITEYENNIHSGRKDSHP